MMTARTGSRDLERWLAAVEAEDRSGLRSLAAGIRNDQQAVTNGLTLHWNSGKVEGTASKIKVIKRQMYGRAGFDLQARHLAPCVTRVTKFAAEPKIRARASFLSGIRHFAVHSSWLHKGDCRLDAQSYAGGSAEALAIMEASGLPLEPIRSVSGTMWRSVQTQARTNFKRFYSDRNNGIPFVNSRTMFGFPLRPERFLSQRMQKLSELMVPEG